MSNLKFKKMKKTIVILAAASALITGTVSCKKKDIQAERDAITQTVDVSLNTDEAYLFTLPKNLRDDPYEITTQASHYSISELGVNSAGERIFKYTPAQGYVGTDQIIVSNDQEREEHKTHPGGPLPGGPNAPAPPKGNCQNKQGVEDHYIITFNINIKGTENQQTLILTNK